MSTQQQSSATAGIAAETAKQQNSSSSRSPRAQLDPIPFSDESDSEPELFDCTNEPGQASGGHDEAALHYESEEQYELEAMNLSKSQLTEVTREQTIYSGYLMKRGEIRKAWKKRWFILRSSELVYYKDQKEYKLLGIIPLDSILACAEVQRTKKRKSKRANVFGVVTTKRKFYFAAPSPEDMLSWLHSIRETRAAAVSDNASLHDEEPQHTTPLKRHVSPVASLPDKTNFHRSVALNAPNSQQAPLEISATSASNGRTVTFVVQRESSGRPASVATTTVHKTEPANEMAESSLHKDAAITATPMSSQNEEDAHINKHIEKTSFDEYADDEFDLMSDDEEAAAIILADAEEVDDLDEGEDEDYEEGEMITRDETLNTLTSAHIIKSGQLHKRGGPRKIWKKRWFVLRPTQLVYYKDQREYKSLGIIDLAQVKAVAAIPRKKRVNVFGVLTTRRKYYFQAGSPEELLGWTHALREACQAARSRRSSTKEEEAPVEKPANHRRSLLPSWATTRSSVDSSGIQHGTAKTSGSAPVSNQSGTSINTGAASQQEDTILADVTGNSSDQPLQGYLTKQSQNNKVGIIRVRPASFIYYVFYFNNNI
ncbi:hypothetical protein BDF19DRAFT_434993 [Syncephalis fuscata]|nr:hypothetical protein BDF19DRAFT_434993 [Syncephalis fuscata]